ncbi:DNA-formamidopyrimidine glycosylase family protein [Streptomyces platensis]|uniref:DNA-formamidopyrimidine glycosylase family protein n=1 Tax=Streptomyces platensis TaxID=58346 RepID=UPI00332483BF
MPELPDVEAFRGILASCAQGRRIRRTEVYDAGVLHGVSAGRLSRELTGRRFAEPELVDEILWRARLHPARPAGALSADEHGRLHTALRRKRLAGRGTVWCPDCRPAPAGGGGT